HRLKGAANCFILRSTLVRGGDAELRLPKRRRDGHVSGSDGARIFFASHAGIATRRPSSVEVQLLTLSAPQSSRNVGPRGALTFVMIRMRRETRLPVLALMPP